MTAVKILDILVSSKLPWYLMLGIVFRNEFEFYLIQNFLKYKNQSDKKLDYRIRVNRCHSDGY